jgi:hypothetical protein
VSRSSRFVACAAAFATFASLAFAANASAAPAAARRITIKHARLDWAPPRSAAQINALKEANAKASIPLWTNSVKDGTSTFTYTMVGKDPSIHQATPSTTVKTVLVPLRIHLTNGDVFDPSAANSCDSATALSRTQKSPVFVAQNWSASQGVPLGKATYDDAFQREEFYKFTKPGAINPGYHVKLPLTTMPTVTVNVPVADWAEGTAPCANGKLGAMEISWFENLVKNTLIPNIPNATTVFPLFLLENVVMYQGVPGNCCVLGFHDTFMNGGKFQTFGVANYDNTGDFSGTADVSALTHEVSEWMNDPNVVNPTKPWGHIGQVSGCQANLETGDPLSGTIISDTINGKTYHLQELAFFSWFYHQKPSIGANGWYSSGGTFRTPAKKCS